MPIVIVSNESRIITAAVITSWNRLCQCLPRKYGYQLCYLTMLLTNRLGCMRVRGRRRERKKKKTKENRESIERGACNEIWPEWALRDSDAISPLSVSLPALFCLDCVLFCLFCVLFCLFCVLFWCLCILWLFVFCFGRVCVTLYGVGTRLSHDVISLHYTIVFILYNIIYTIVWCARLLLMSSYDQDMHFRHNSRIIVSRNKVVHFGPGNDFW